MNIAAVILAGGSGKRLGTDENKIFAKVLGKTVLEHSISPFLRCGIDQIIIVCKEGEKKRIKDILGKAFSGVLFTYAQAGKERQQSCENGIEALKSDITHVLVHDCARMLITASDIKRCIEALKSSDAVITAMPLKDTIKLIENDKIIKTPDRRDYIIVQTPQCFSKKLIKEAHAFAKETHFMATDDASLVEHMGKQVKYIEGSYENIKITTKDDIIIAENILRKRGHVMNDSKPIRIGNGFDVHQLVKGRKLILGGVSIEHEKGLLGHSDADVLTHSIMDAVLGAAALGDIGKYFPDNDEKYKDADSIKLLREVMILIKKQGFVIGNIDAVVMAQRPKLQPYMEKMRRNIADACAVDITSVNVKATTTEHLSFIGREEGIASLATVILYKMD